MEKKILCLFDYKATTGFATVSQNMVPYLKKTFGQNILLHILAINYFGERVLEEDGTLIVSAPLAFETEDKKDAFGRHEFLRALTVNDYDGIFIMQDLGVIAPMMGTLRKIWADRKKAGKKQIRSMVYFPMDCTMARKWFDDLDFFDTVVLYTDYSRWEVLKIRPDLAGRLKIILHGVNHRDFFPISGADRHEKRIKFFGEANAKKFIVGNINRNQPRKDIPTTMFGFNEYRKSYKKDALLYLHMNPKDHQGWDLHNIAEDLGLVLGEDIMFPPEGMENAGADTGQLNDIFNMLDVFVTTTTGEGFGLTIVEAMACEVPVIAPLNTSITEISNHGDRIFALEESYPYCSHFDSHIREQSDMYELAEKIDLVRNNDCLAGEKIQKAKAYAASLTWGNICARWAEEWGSTFGIEKPKKDNDLHRLPPRQATRT